MNTVSGPIILNFCTSASILDFHTGLKKSIIIVCHNHQKIVEFMIKNQEYYLGFDWKILQPPEFVPGGFIKVGDIIEKKIEFVYDKFNRKHFLQNVRENKGNLGIPENMDCPWYDKMLVISL